MKELPICKLCLNEYADKLNSHIIPKFLSKRLFEDTKPRHSIVISKNPKKKINKIQDTPKENNIFCTMCEKRFETIETEFAPYNRLINNFNNSPSFEEHNLFGQQFLCNKNIPSKLFSLFIYSLIWRTSISNKIEFAKFTLDVVTKEKIRSFLINNLSDNKTDFKKKLSQNTIFPEYQYLFIKSKNNLRGILAAYNFSKNTRLLFLVDYAILFYEKDEELIPNYKYFICQKDYEVKLLLANDNTWEVFFTSIANQLLE